MDTPMQSEIEEQLRVLCRKIAVARGLDDELQEELFTHMEDKWSAYMRGEEKVSEQDALILVREHFGEPRAVQSMLSEVHRDIAAVSLTRAVIAVLTAFFVASIFGGLLQLAFGVLETVTLARGYAGQIDVAVHGFFMTSLPLMSTLAVAAFMLRRWKRELVQRESVWFVRLPVRSILRRFLLVWVVYQALPRVGVAASIDSAVQLLGPVPASFILYAETAADFLCVVAMCLLLFAWLRGIASKGHVLAAASVAWLVFVLGLTMVGSLPGLSYVISSGDIGAPFPLTLISGPQVKASLLLHGLALRNSPAVLLATWVLGIGVGLAGYSVMALYAWNAKQRTRLA